MSNVATVGYNRSSTKNHEDVTALKPQILDWSAHDNLPHVPNAETLVALKEGDEILRRLETGEIQPRFNNLAEFFVSLFSEDDDINANP